MQRPLLALEMMEKLYWDALATLQDQMVPVPSLVRALHLETLLPQLLVYPPMLCQHVETVSIVYCPV